MIRRGKKLLRLILGGVLLGVGVILSIPGVPGPGVVVILLGLSVLSTDFEFARRLLARLKSAARRVFNRRRGRGPAL